MKKLAILTLGLMALTFTAVPGHAHEEGKGHPRPQYAIRELNEAKEILGKLPPDADGHIAKASQSIDQAIQELSAVKGEVKKS